MKLMFKRAKPGQFNAGKGVKKRRIPKPIRNTLIGAGVLLVLAIIAGGVYTWYNGQKTDKEIKTTFDVPPTADPFLTPGERDPNAPIGAAVVYVTSPVKLGANATMTVRTTPGATCDIKVAYGDNGQVKSSDSGLKTKTADIYGSSSWTWTIEKSAPVGNWPMFATCAINGKSAVVQGYVKVIQ